MRCLYHYLTPIILFSIGLEVGEEKRVNKSYTEQVRPSPLSYIIKEREHSFPVYLPVFCLFVFSCNGAGAEPTGISILGI